MEEGHVELEKFNRKVYREKAPTGGRQAPITHNKGLQIINRRGFKGWL